MFKTLNLNKQLLSDLYIKEKKTTREIGKILKCCASTVAEYLHKYHIIVRSIGKKKLNLNRKLLYKLYIDEKESMSQIAKKLGCSISTIWIYLCQYGITLRSPGMVDRHHSTKAKQKISTANIGKNNGMYGKSSPHGKGTYYKNIYMRSSWEIRIAQLLDKAKIDWLYEPQRFELKERTYTPDFYLPKWDLWIEVKGWMSPKSRERIKQFQELYRKENLLIIDEFLYQKYCV